MHFRKRIGEDRLRLILEGSIRLNGDHDDGFEKTVYIDSTVQEKNISFPIDGKLLKKIVHHSKKMSYKHGFKRCQSYTRILKLSFFIHVVKKKVLKADRKLKTIAER